MHGISAIIVIILILMIVVALAALSYTFFSGIFTSTTETTEESIERTTASLAANMKIESISHNKIYLRNVGQTPLTGFSVYINDVPVNFTGEETLQPGEVATMNVNYCICNPNNNLKITTAEGIVTTKSVGSICYPETVLCLGFDEGTGTIVHDSSPYGNDGTLYNRTMSCYNTVFCPTWVNGKYGKAIKFIDQYEQLLNISHSESLNISSENFTILTWIKPEINTQFLVAAKNTDTWENYWVLYGASGILYFQIESPSESSVTQYTFPDNNLWQHIAVTKEDSTVKLYHNGSEVGVGSFSDNADNLGSIWIGGDTPAVFYSNCIIDELIILNKTLTEAEILEEFEK